MRTSSFSVKAVVVIAGLIVGYAAIKEVSAWVIQHWLLLSSIVLLLIAITAGALLYRRHRTSAYRAENASLERHLARADEMDIPQFEAWVGRLLLRDGFRKVRFVGRSGDFGSNFVATAPEGRRVVVRAKPDDGTLSKRGSRHIQALGADAHARWKVDIALLVTNADLHPLKTAARHDALASQLGVILVDRLELAAWVADRQPPAELAATAASAG
jgi:restriction system protein